MRKIKISLGLIIILACTSFITVVNVSNESGSKVKPLEIVNTSLTPKEIFTKIMDGNASHLEMYDFLTLLSNMFTNLNLTDMETCYKVFRNEVLKQIEIKENSFGVEPELTAKVAKLGCRIYEVGISYSGRTYCEGKKINWKDGVLAIWCILKYNLFSSSSFLQKK